MQRILTSSIPVIAALAAFFLVLPRGGADVTVRIVPDEAVWTFAPAQAEAPAGGRVAFRNLTDVTHTADCIECPWRSGDVAPGEIVFVPVGAAGAYTYQCRYHGEVMRGELTVT